MMHEAENASRDDVYTDHIYPCMTWGSHGGENEDGCLLGCSAVWTGVSLQAFQRSLLPPSSGCSLFTLYLLHVQLASCWLFVTGNSCYFRFIMKCRSALLRRTEAVKQFHRTLLGACANCGPRVACLGPRTSGLSCVLKLLNDRYFTGSRSS
jgi:hypothetical protein